MATKKKVVKKDQCKTCKCEVNMTHIDKIWDVVEELQENLDFINSNLKKIMTRMGL